MSVVSPSNFDIPLMSPDSLAYSVGNDYNANVVSSVNSNSLTIRHEITGENLVRELLEKGDAVFAAEVSSPSTTYREIYKADSDRVPHLTQNVEWNPADVIYPIYVRPLVLSDLTQPIDLVLTESNGVHSIWSGVNVRIRPATVLACSDFFFKSGAHSILKLFEDSEMREGSFRVLPNTNNGFQFDVFMPTSLFNAMINPGQHTEHRDSILTAALASGLHLLRTDHLHSDGPGNDWQDFPALRRLNEFLTQNGLPAWDDQDFHPDEAASSLRPLLLANILSNE